MSTSSVLANPCPKRWEELAGDDRRRDCAACGKTVLAVAEMGLEEARAASKAGACLSFVELPGGLVRTQEGWRLWRSVALAGALVGCDEGPRPPASPPVLDEAAEVEVPPPSDGAVHHTMGKPQVHPTPTASPDAAKGANPAPTPGGPR